MKIDLSLKNETLYRGCEIETVAGKLNLITDVGEAIDIIGSNINGILDGISSNDRDSVTLTGAMAVWAYLIVFHAVVHKFRSVYYHDGRSNPVLIAKHG
jgi:hypothetical protein